ncbi:MAG: dephospho-CoA kinase [Verrucomicrobia bacterium]|nr:dephospho-CoA kinase [Verrucomicrobiota bacterium]
MILLGLTGGIGTGKSAAAEILRRRGLPVADTDLIAREVVEPGQPALAEVVKEFGPEILDAAGRLRRDELARRVFSDTEARRKLEAILHPRIRDEWRRVTDGWRAAGQKLGVVVIPLLFETDAAGSFDATICTACSAATQRQRLGQRGWSGEQIAARLAAQWPLEKKMAAATFVVWTEAGLEIHEAQLERILARW